MKFFKKTVYLPAAFFLLTTFVLGSEKSTFDLKDFLREELQDNAIVVHSNRGIGVCEQYGGAYATAPVVHPYTNFAPSPSVAIRFPSLREFFSLNIALPENLRRLVWDSGLDIEKAEIYMVAQNHESEEYLNNTQTLRAHYWGFPDSPYEISGDFSQILNIRAAIFSTDGSISLDAQRQCWVNGGVQIHNKAVPDNPEMVVSSPNNFQISGLNINRSQLFWSAIHLPQQNNHQERVALTLHVMMNRDLQDSLHALRTTKYHSGEQLSPSDVLSFFNHLRGEIQGGEALNALAASLGLENIDPEAARVFEPALHVPQAHHTWTDSNKARSLTPTSNTNIPDLIQKDKKKSAKKNHKKPSKNKHKKTVKKNHKKSAKKNHKKSVKKNHKKLVKSTPIKPNSKSLDPKTKKRAVKKTLKSKSVRAKPAPKVAKASKNSKSATKGKLRLRNLKQRKHHR